MFLTPAGEPFWGGTYFPPEARYGRPGFAGGAGAGQPRSGRPSAPRSTGNIDALKEALAGLARAAAGRASTPALREQAAAPGPGGSTPSTAGSAARPSSRRRRSSTWSGGMRSRTGDAAARHAVLHTLANICQGGIYDHLGGGFARYAVDALWLVPHFEKMLYDNAQLLELLLADAYADTQNPLFRGAGRGDGRLARARDAGRGRLRLQRSMPTARARRASSTSGMRAEIDRLLGPDAAAFPAGLRGHRRRQLGRQHGSEPPAPAGPARGGRGGGAARQRGPAAGGARPGGCRPGATTRSWPIGTA